MMNAVWAPVRKSIKIKGIGILVLTVLLLGCSKQPKATVPDAGMGNGAAAQSGNTPNTTEAAEGPITVENVGFETPESVYHLAASDVYLVSNISGSPLEKDNNGFITRLSPDGSVPTLKWIAGGENGVTLNAPKGMTIADDVLYVTDIDVVRMFDVANGAAKGDIKIEGATFLNDLTTAADGAVYVSDTGWKAGENGFENTGTDAIWKIVDGRATKVPARADLGNPNGLLASTERIWMVNAKGELFEITEDGAMGTPTQLPGGGLDGIVQTGGNTLLISSWGAKSVFEGTAGGKFVPVAKDISSPADIGYDAKRNRLLVPVFTENKVQIIPLPPMLN
ncbi:MAG: hypothetical protein JXR76_23290 [Deltaproteobacteria bacterium]|nr:hypothetical protein [Deltaproteobacteria bacterium]